MRSIGVVDACLPGPGSITLYRLKPGTRRLRMHIRKFVGIAAGFGAAVALGLSAQTAVAHVGGQPAGAAPTTDLTSLSPACMAALQAIRSAIAADPPEGRGGAQEPAPGTRRA